MPFPMSTMMGGTSTSFPDVCKTPTPTGPLPMPYPNLAMFMQANPVTCALKVKVLGMSVLTLQTQVLMSSGDEAGSLGGMVSGMIKGPLRFTMGSVIVSADGAPVVYQTCSVTSNGTNANTLGVHDTPSQILALVGM